MANRIMLNETSYHGSGAIQEIATEAKAHGFKKALVCAVPDLIKFGAVSYTHLDVYKRQGVMSAKQLDREDELLGKRLSYCATCDGMFYKDKRIAVICNDKKYEHEVKYLADLATEVLYFPAYNDSEIELPNVKISQDVPCLLYTSRCV